MRPQPPRMLTVILAILLTVVGLALIFYDQGSINFVQGLSLPNDIQRQLVSWMGDRTVAWGALVLSPVLLIIGSLVSLI